MRRTSLVGLCLAALALPTACSNATRALVHEEDIAKVFPWPRDESSVQIRVKPETTMANTCFLFGSWETISVGPDTTFYMVDDLGKNYAYTPSRSPIRRLSKVDSMEIRWPVKVSEPAASEAEGGEGQAEGEGKDKGEDKDKDKGGQAPDASPPKEKAQPKPKPGPAEKPSGTGEAGS
ncbi:MAG: hypothetical protein JXR96_03165 [Deltaproteobacteria bacterium]|nr:hypothetical protein [Deltaproteobacteria bacterium]